MSLFRHKPPYSLQVLQETVNNMRLLRQERDKALSSARLIDPRKDPTDYVAEARGYSKNIESAQKALDYMLAKNAKY